MQVFTTKVQMKNSVECVLHSQPHVQAQYGHGNRPEGWGGGAVLTSFD